MAYCHSRSAAFQTHPLGLNYSSDNQQRVWLFKLVPDEPVILIGDVNNDGHVSIGDVTILIDYLLGSAPQSFNELNADVTQDGNISIGDVTALIDKLLSSNQED